MEAQLAGKDVVAADRGSAVAAQLDFFFGPEPQVGLRCMPYNGQSPQDETGTESSGQSGCKSEAAVCRVKSTIDARPRLPEFPHCQICRVALSAACSKHTSGPVGQYV